MSAPFLVRVERARNDVTEDTNALDQCEVRDVPSRFQVADSLLLELWVLRRPRSWELR
jgi:hypothetical protein